MIAGSEAEFTHVASEVVHDNPEFIGVVFLSQDGKHTFFEEHLNPQALSRETSERLKRDGFATMRSGSSFMR